MGRGASNGGLPKSRLLLLVGILLCASFFGALAYLSPMKSLPDPPVSAFPECSEYEAGNAGGMPTVGDYNCYSTELAAYQVASIPSLHVYQSYAEVAEGLVVTALLFLTIPFLKTPALLKKKVLVPDGVRALVSTAGVAGFGVFLFGESANLLYAHTRNPLCLSMFHDLPNAPVATILGLVTASLCVALLQSRNGVFKGIRSGVLFCALFVMLAQIALLIFDFKEISFYVTMFSEGWFLAGHGTYLGHEYVADGIPAISNWFVLIVSSGLLSAIGVSAHRRLWR